MDTTQIPTAHPLTYSSSLRKSFSNLSKHGSDFAIAETDKDIIGNLDIRQFVKVQSKGSMFNIQEIDNDDGTRRFKDNKFKIKETGAELLYNSVGSIVLSTSAQKGSEFILMSNYSPKKDKALFSKTSQPDGKSIRFIGAKITNEFLKAIKKM